MPSIANTLRGIKKKRAGEEPQGLEDTCLQCLGGSDVVPLTQGSKQQILPLQGEEHGRCQP